MTTQNEFIPLAKPFITEDEVTAVSDTIHSGWWTTGPKVTEFEEKFAGYLAEQGKPLHCIGLNSCTSGMFLALKAIEIKKGDEIIVPTWTFAATAQVVEWCGARPIFCDIEKESLNIDLTEAEKLITSKTKAIMPVHMAGYPCDMERLAALASNYSLKVIEDAAHAIGTRYNGTKIGNFSDLTCFSFYATKNLAMGEGGAVVSHNPELIESIRKLSYFGINKEAYKRYTKAGTWRYDIEELGYKCNLDSLHAAIGIVQLEKIDRLNQIRRKIAQTYKEELDSRITFSKDSADHYHTYHLFPIFLPQNIDRDSFILGLKDKNIGASVHFIPLHLHSYYKAVVDQNKFSVANEAFTNVVSIPLFPSMSDDDLAFVIENINKTLGEN